MPGVLALVPVLAGLGRLMHYLVNELADDAAVTSITRARASSGREPLTMLTTGSTSSRR